MAERTCRICGDAYNTSPASERCCSVTCLREHWRSKAQKRDGTKTKTSKPCGFCAHPTGVNLGSGRDRRFCSKRCLEANRLVGKATAIAVKDCIDCSAAFVTPTNYARPRCGRCHDLHLTRKARSSGARYRARRRNARIEMFGYAEIFERDGWRCGLCSRAINRTLKFPHPMSASLDHVVPLSLGGEHSRANVQASHFDCNNRKNNGVLIPEQLRLIG